ncbi:virulence protein RhuM/Fic/DOC family protein [Candidatus Parcubacteria bacterium]|nr:virulence protein RhuM/Fic/DOC family protein [Candidatus Parcubacteria bacterium]
MGINKKEQFNKGEIIIYETFDKQVDLKVRFENETVWLRQSQIAKLFNKDRTVITKHINKIFKDEEVEKKSNVQKMHIANSDKPVTFYSLDIILAVGYRTNSKNAIKFRQWATNVLKQYLLKGYAINQKRLKESQNKFIELQETISFLSEKSKKKNLIGQEVEILSLLKSYSKSLTLLEAYDKNKLKISKGKKEKRKLNFEDCLKIIKKIKQELINKKEASDIFGNIRDGSFEGIVKGIYQTFGGQYLYQGMNDKAAHILYLIIKDHPFSDGNKRIASFLFVYFLDLNNYLHRKTGEKKINDNALVALALLVAESKPKEKDIMIKLIMNLII